MARKQTERAAIFKDYQQVWYALFTKEPVGEETRARCDGGTYLYVDADMLYEA